MTAAEWRCPNDPSHRLMSRRIEPLFERIRWANNTPWCPTCDVDALPRSESLYETTKEGGDGR